MKSKFINFIYLILWVTPLFFFIKDFFIIEESMKILNSSFLQTVLFTLKQAFLSSILAFIIAIIPAYFISFQKGKLVNLLESLLFVPFFFPVISTITVFSIIFNIEFFKSFNILYTLKAILIAHVFYNSPIFLKYISEGIKRVPYEIIEAFKLDGLSNFKIFVKGYMPLILPQVFKGFILVFTYSMLSFGIILSLGGIKFSTIEIEIASTFMGNFNFSKAIMFGIVQFVILLLINSGGIFIKEYELNGEAKIKKVSVIAKIVSVLYLIFEYSIVILAFLFSFFNFFTGEFSINSYLKIFSKEFNLDYPIIQSLINSISISLIVSVISVIIIYILIENYSSFTRLIIFSNIGISGAFLSISLYYLNVLFDIPLTLLLSIGYIMISIPIGYSFMYQYIKKFSSDVEDLSKLDLDSSFKRIIYVKFPILKNIFIASFLQIFAIIFGEFTIGYTMQIGDTFPMASLVNYSLLSNKLYLESSAFGSIILLVVFSFFLVGEFFKKKY